MWQRVKKKRISFRKKTILKMENLKKLFPNGYDTIIMNNVRV